MEATQSTAYSVLAADALGCISKDTIEIKNAYPAPAVFLPADTAICATDPFTIHPVQSFSAYRWSTGASTESITVQIPGTYRLQVEDDHWCAGLDSIRIVAKDCGDRFFVPNAFTPNNDGVNDSFKPLISGRVSDYEFSVYNLYGQMVFSSRRPGEGWNGKYRNRFQNAGTYIWISRYKTGNEAMRLDRGLVELVR